MGYEGFAKVKSEVAQSGAKDPGAVAAAIGRKKYGAKAMTSAAKSGKSLRGHRTISGSR
jgi:hypothetical protein